MLLYGAIVPGAAAGLLALLFARLVPKEQHSFAAGSLALGGGFAGAFALYFGTADLLSPSSWQWVFWAGVAAMPVGLLPSRMRSTLGLGVFVAVASGLLLYPMLSKLVPHAMEASQVLVWAAGLGVFAAVLASALESSARTFPAKSLLTAWTLYGAGFAGLMFELGSARLGQMSGFVAAGCGALWILAWIRPDPRLLTTASVAFVMVLMVVGANGYFFGYDVAGLPVLLTAVPPLLLAVGARWRWLRERKTLATGLVLCGTVVVPLACAYGIAVLGGEVDPYGGGELPY
ncbi:MAG: hypothetical protein ACYTEP_11300 [Planctomycetota bacterium]